MSEMAVSADQIIVIGRGKFITQGSVDDAHGDGEGHGSGTRVRPRRRSSAVLRANHATIEETNDEALSVSDLSAEQIGRLAFDAGVAIFELTPQRASLEEVFMDLTADAVEYGSTGARHES